MACKDPSIALLDKFGYNIAKLPRTGVEPMDAADKDQSTEFLGQPVIPWPRFVRSKYGGY